MLLVSMTVCAGVKADIYLLSESFCTLVTNSAQTGQLDAQADAIRVVETSANDKGLYLEAGKRHSLTAEAEIPGASNEFVFSFDIKGEGSIADGNLSFYDGGGAAWKFISFGADNSIALSDGKRISGQGIGSMTGIDVVFDMTASACSVYLNGKCIVNKWYISSMPKEIRKAGFSFTASKAGSAAITLDGIWAYNSDSPKTHSALPHGSYNTESVEYIPSENGEAPIGSATYVSRTFDEANTDAFTGFTLDTGTNTIELAKDKKTGNSYVRMKKNYTSSAFIDVRQTFSQRFVVEIDLSMGDTLFNGSLYLRGTPNSQYVLKFTSSGAVTGPDGSKICNLQKGKWVHLAFAIDMSTSLSDVYVDGKLVHKEAEFPLFVSSTSIVRLYIDAGGTGSGGELLIDNYRIYDGAEPLTQSASSDENKSEASVVMNNANTLLSSEAEEEKLLSGSAAIATDGSYIAHGGKKIPVSAPAYSENGCFMVPLRAMAELYGHTPQYDAATDSVSVKDITIKDGAIYAAGSRAESDSAPVIKNGVTYISACDFAKYISGGALNIYDHGVAVFSDKGTAFTTAEEKKVWAYLFYQRPDAQKILSDFESNAKNVHPRVAVNREQIERIKRLYNSGDTFAVSIYNSVISSANRYSKMTPATYTDSLSVARAVRDRFYAMGFAYLLTGNKDYAQPVWEQMKVASEFREWGELEKFLGCGEMLGAFAVAYDWMYDLWSDEQKKFIEETMMSKGLIWSYHAYRGTLPPGNSSNRSWYAWENNWNQVCNGGTVMAACALMDVYPAECSMLICDALRSNENGLEAFYPYGSYAEGMGYQAYAVRYLTTMFNSVKFSLGTDYGMLKIQGLADTCECSFNLCGPTTEGNNYHDVETVSSKGTAYLWWFATTFDRKSYFDEAMFQVDEYNEMPSVYDAMFYNPEFSFTESSGTEIPLDAYYAGEELVSMRSAWKDPYATWISYHGGSNIMSMHGHIDTGTFILEMLGERWSYDLGSDTYSSNYWSETGRPTYYRIRAEGHNTLVLNPDASGGQILGEESFSPVVRSESKPRGAISVLDMTNAYSENASKVLRGFMLTDDRRNVLMRDEMQLPSDTEVYWFMHTNADIEIADSNTAILTKNGARLKCVMTSNLSDASFKVLDASPMPTSPSNSANTPNPDYKRLTISGKGKGYAYIQVKFMDEASPEANDALPTLGIGEWTIPDGEPTELPELEDIVFDGKALDGFNSNNKNYSVYVAESADASTISIEPVCAEGVEAEVTRMNTGAKIEVYYPQNRRLATVYNISYTILPLRSDVEGYSQYPLTNVLRSSEQSGNSAFHAVDGDVTTRWAANGEQWLMIELENAASVDAVGIYMMNSATRTSEVKIELSQDMNTWETAFEGTIGGVRDGYDIIDAGGKMAKYVRLTANGNSVNSWNSVMEFTALKKK